MTRQATASINLKANDYATAKIKTVQRSLIGFGRTASTVMGSLTGFGSVAGVAGLTMLAKRAIDTGSRLDDVSKKLGIGTDFLQEFGFAAREVGVRTEAAEMGLQRFVRRVGEAQQGTGELLPVLKQYGIQLKNNDGTLRNVESVLMDYADAIRGTADPQERLRMAFKAFDSEGAALVTVLKDGSEGLDEFAKRARELGQIMDKETVQSLANAENEIEQFGQKVTVIIGDTIAYWREFVNEINKSEFNIPNLESMLGATPVSEFQKRIGGLKSEEERIDLIGELIDRYTDLQDLIELNAASGGKLISDEQVNQVNALMISYRRLVKDAERAQNTPIINQQSGAIIGETTILLQDLESQAFSLGEAFESTLSTEPVVTFADTLNNWVAPGFENVKALTGEVKDEVETKFGMMANVADTFATGLENGLVNAAAQGKSAFGDMAQFILAELQRMLVRAMLFQAFTGLGGAIGGNFGAHVANFGARFGGTAAAGGPVQGGRRYIVGERGPEMITMGGNGYVTPNHQMGGPTFNVDMRGASLEAVQRLEQFVATVNGSIEQRSVRAVQDAFSRQPSYMRR